MEYGDSRERHDESIDLWNRWDGICRPASHLQRLVSKSFRRLSADFPPTSFHKYKGKSIKCNWERLDGEESSLPVTHCLTDSYRVDWELPNANGNYRSRCHAQQESARSSQNLPPTFRRLSADFPPTFHRLSAVQVAGGGALRQQRHSPAAPPL